MELNIYLKPVIRVILLVTVFTGINGLNGAYCGEPEYLKLKENKPFVFSAGFGYGIANNPCGNCNENSAIGGATLSLSLGYKINERFKIEFGPSFWIEGNDLINKNVADSERPNNKRTLVTFTGSYTPFRNVPLAIALGGGAGLLNYTPEKSTVSFYENKFATTEIFRGFAGTLGVSYKLNLCEKIKLFPSMNFWYMDLQKPKISYNTHTDYKKASVISDFRVSLNYAF